MAVFTWKNTQASGNGGGGSGEANTTSNVGGGLGIALAKSGVNLPFKTLTAGSNVTLTDSPTEVQISALGGGSGEVNTASSQGTGESLVLAKSGTTLPFKSLLGGTNVTLTSQANEVVINAVDAQVASNTTAIAAKAEQSALNTTNSNVSANTTAISGKQAAHSLNVVGTSGASQTLDFAANDSFKVTLTANCIFTLSNPVTGNTYVIILVQDATGSRTVTWPGTVKFQGGTAPTLTTAANSVDVVTLFWDGVQYLTNFGGDFK